MAENEILIHFSSIIPFIDTNDFREDSLYLAFELHSGGWKNRQAVIVKN